MRSKEELTRLFSDYFGDKLSPAQIDNLVADVTAATRNRQARAFGSGQAVPLSSQPAQPAQYWSQQVAF